MKEYLEPEEVERAAEEGDVVVIDYTGYVDGETSDGLQGTEYSLELGSGTFVPGFEDQLVGAIAGEEREVILTFPDTYYEDLAGKEATFDVYVHAVQEYQMDGYTDEFVSENMGYDDIEAFEEAVRQELDAEAEANLEYDLVLAFLEDCEFDIQEEDVEAYLDEMMSEYETYAVAYGMELEDYLNNYLGVTEEQLREIFRESAEFRVQLTIAFHDVAEAEGLTVSDEEYDEMVNSLVETYGYENAEAVEAVYTEEKIRESLMQEKVIDLIEDAAVLI